MVSSTSVSASPDALPYTSPSLVTVLVLSSYLLLLSVFYHAFQRLLSAGILGPLVLGAIYARPLGDILPLDVQSTILSIGFLGLILLIVQGGIDARMDILASPVNLGMAVLVGATGVILPIGLSMALLPAGFGYGLLESFTVGAALASTSLGTTFAVLSTYKDRTKEGRVGDKTQQGIADTRVGTILVGAALLDDIIGLVITSVVSTLGSSTQSGGGLSSVPPWTIARPVVSSFLLLVISWLLSRYILAPLSRSVVIPALIRYTAAARTPAEPSSSGRVAGGLRRAMAGLHADLGLQQMIATTLLVSTVLAYCVISEEIGSSLLIGAFCAGAMMKYLYALWAERTSSRGEQCVWSPEHLFTHTALGVVQETLLMPFFFSSIGSAIPVRSMFTASTVWRGIIFAGLMALAKVAAGAWLLLADRLERRKPNDIQLGPLDPSAELVEPPVWPAALFLGVSLMSRGEIGYLIINIANRSGLVGQQAFNVAIWAITLNTLAGPLAIAFLMRSQYGPLLLGLTPASRRSRWS